MKHCVTFGSIQPYEQWANLISLLSYWKYLLKVYSNLLQMEKKIKNKESYSNCLLFYWNVFMKTDHLYKM